MRFKTCLLMMSLPLGACGSLSGLREAPAPVEIAPRIVIPAECRIDPVEPMAVDPPVLPELPATTDPAYLAIRTQRAELAGLFFQGERDAEKDARIENAVTQAICASWARSQDQ